MAAGGHTLQEPQRATAYRRPRAPCLLSPSSTCLVLRVIRPTSMTLSCLLGSSSVFSSIHVLFRAYVLHLLPRPRYLLANCNPEASVRQRQQINDRWWVQLTLIHLIKHCFSCWKHLKLTLLPEFFWIGLNNKLGSDPCMPVSLRRYMCVD